MAITFPNFQCSSCHRRSENEVTASPPIGDGLRDGWKTQWQDDTWVCVPVNCPICDDCRIQCRYCPYNCAATSKVGKGVRNFVKRHHPCNNNAGIVANQNPSPQGIGTNDDNEAVEFEVEAVDYVAEGSGTSEGGRTSTECPSYDPVAIQSLFPENHASATYFEERIANKDDKQSGLKGMVYRSLNKLRPNQSTGQLAPPQITNLIVQLVQLLIYLPNRIKTTLIGFSLGLLIYSAGYSGGEGLRENMSALPPFPTSISDAKRLCVSKKNQTSFWAQIPCERVKILSDNMHVSISLDELIDHIMAHGTELSFMLRDGDKRNTSGINGCEAATTCLQRMQEAVIKDGQHPRDYDGVDQTAYAYLSLWSNAFITAWVKKKDNSAWCMTVTIAPPNDNDRSEYHTHCIALGPKGANHNVVVESILDELEEIRKGKWRYYAYEDRWIYTSFDCIVYLADRPERADITQTLSHSGRTSKRALHAAFTNSNLLASCDTCFKMMVSQAIDGDDAGIAGPSPSCQRCCNWDYLNNLDGAGWKESGSVLSSCYADKYPTTISSTNLLPVPTGREIPVNSHLRPCEQSFEWLFQGAELAIQELEVNKWSACRNPAGWSAVPAENYLNSMGVATNVVTKVKQNLRKRKQEQNNPTEDPIIPKIWKSGYDLQMFIDCPMHMLFLGIVGSILEIFASFLVKNKHETAFNAHINGYLTDIISFRLDYCILKKLPKKSWISENVLGLTRILPFLVSQYFLNFNVSSEDEHRVHWERLINALYVMMAMLMTKDRVDTENLDKHIKIFLTCCARVGDMMREGDDSGAPPFWEKKGNFYSLLNLPAQIKRFGNVRWYWDGK